MNPNTEFRRLLARLQKPPGKRWWLAQDATQSWFGIHLGNELLGRHWIPGDDGCDVVMSDTAYKLYTKYRKDFEAWSKMN